MASRTTASVLLLGVAYAVFVAVPTLALIDDDCNGGPREFDWPAAREEWPTCAPCPMWGVGVPCIRDDVIRPANCNGSGMRLCGDAHEVPMCPEPCQYEVGPESA